MGFSVFITRRIARRGSSSHFESLLPYIRNISVGRYLWFRTDRANPVQIPISPCSMKEGEEIKTKKEKMHANESENEKQEKKSYTLPYRSVVGCLQYLVGGSRPDLGTSVRILSEVEQCHEKDFENDSTRTETFSQGQVRWN